VIPRGSVDFGLKTMMNMGYYTFGLGDICWVKLHDSIHDHYTEADYAPWGSFRDGSVEHKDYSWPIGLFLGFDGELLDVHDVLRRWVLDYVFGKYGKFYCCVWLDFEIYLESGIGDGDYKLGVSRVWHEMRTFEQYQWFLDSGKNWKWDCQLEVPAGEKMFVSR